MGRRNKQQAGNVASGTALYSQAELAVIFGVSRQMIFHIEQRALRKIRYALECEAKAAGMSVREWLFDA